MPDLPGHRGSMGVTPDGRKALRAPMILLYESRCFKCGWKFVHTHLLPLHNLVAAHMKSCPGPVHTERWTVEVVGGTKAGKP